jgi:long-chain acyl-CoA synthetase
VRSRTLYQVLEEAARAYGDAPALIQAGSPPWSWNQYRQAVDEIAAGLRALGIGKGDIVALNSETRLEFYLADMGILANGSVAAALYPSYPSKDLVRTMETAGACAAFIENPEMLEALRQAPVRQWILLTGRAAGALALDDLREMGWSSIRP